MGYQSEISRNYLNYSMKQAIIWVQTQTQVLRFTVVSFSSLIFEYGEIREEWTNRDNDFRLERYEELGRDENVSL
jgi:hypothetical protein